jgi:glycosyltransferase involved in cell wall biosynthesis
MGQLVLVLASRVLAVSRATLGEVLRWAPRSKSKVYLAYHGLDPTWYAAAGQKKAQAITIGAVCEDYVRRKGLGTFARVSRLLPEIPFLVIGRHIQSSTVAKLQELGGPNLVLTGYLPDGEMRALLRESAVYVQLSLHEGFGYAVAEAMLSGCQPVVTRLGALPEVVGELGIEAEAGSPESAARAIRLALAHNSAADLRERIVRLFPRERRVTLLHKHVHELLNASRPSQTCA